MDRWMDGQIVIDRHRSDRYRQLDGWMGRWIDRYIDEWMDGQIYRYTDRQIKTD